MTPGREECERHVLMIERARPHEFRALLAFCFVSSWPPSPRMGRIMLSQFNAEPVPSDVWPRSLEYKTLMLFCLRSWPTPIAQSQ